jgi:prepilin peptidase CpaA
MLETIDTTVASWDARHAVLAVGASLTVWAAVSDLSRFTIPNRVVAALVMFGAVYVMIAGLPAIPHMLTFVAALALGFGAYAVRLFGAGDAKLFAALSLWFGPIGSLWLLLLTAVFGAVLAVVWMCSRPLRHALIGVGIAVDPEPSRRIPYGVAIASAALIAFSGLWP